ncbi:MAG: hypothetical protein NZ455_08445 [Bacteroidia bacterium]|nr:hypothetical protein [Bacteroidia bacterium]MDW8345808.1 hypothetical protein [Bacteroidia bacterium]
MRLFSTTMYFYEICSAQQRTYTSQQLSFNIFWACPSLTLGSGYSALRSRSVLRCASHCLTACSVSLTQQPLDVLPYL